MKTKITFALLLVATALAGCGDTSTRNKEAIDRDVGRVDMSLSRLGDRHPVRAGGAQFSDGIYVGASPERSSAALLPARVQRSGAVSLVSRDPLTLQEIARRLTEATGIPHVPAMGPTGQVSSDAEVTRTAADLMADPDATSENAAPTQPPAVRRDAGGDTGEPTMIPRLRGSLSEVLDQISNAFDLEWSYADGRVLLRDYVTRKYQISALPTASSHSTSMDANGMTSSSETASNVWEEVERTLGSMVGDGARVITGQTTGIVTVTAKVSDHNRVAEYIQQLNGTVGQQVSFDVNVLTVSLDDTDDFGIDINAAFTGAEWRGGADGSSGLSDGGSVNIGLLRGDVDVSAVVRALSSQGKVSVATRAGTTTSNNRVAPIQVTDKTGYISGYETETNGDDEVMRATVEEIETGFQMQIFPRILNNRELMVQYAVRLSELKGLKSIGEGTALVQLPEVSTTSFEQQAVLENGQTLILAGFERNRVEAITRRNGLGGAVQNVNNRVATVMLITPRILGRAY